MPRLRRSNQGVTPEGLHGGSTSGANLFQVGGSSIQYPESSIGWVGKKFEIRNGMTTAWPCQASRNVIPTEGRDGQSGGICLCEIPNS